MILITPDGKQITLKWAGRVGEWELTMPNRNNPTLVNDAGINFYFATFGNPSRTIDVNAKHRCVKDYGWVCPYMKQGGHTPCITNKGADRKHLASIEATDWERRQGYKPEGNQLTLFKEGYWHNVKTGEQRWTNDPRPYSITDVVCKEFAVATMEYQQRQLGWNGLKWRIQPLKPDLTWVNSQQAKHKGRYTACVFDTLD